jgi:hypothetical protein
MFLMRDLNNLNDQLQRLGKSEPKGPDANLEQRLLSEFRAYHRRRRHKLMFVWQSAAAVVLAFALAFLLMHNTRHVAPSAARNGVQQFDPAALSGFVPLPYGESGVPLGQSVVMRVQLRASDVTALGVSVPPGNAREQIGADVLIGQDGVARAVRFHQ